MVTDVAGFDTETAGFDTETDGREKDIDGLDIDIAASATEETSKPKTAIATNDFFIILPY